MQSKLTLFLLGLFSIPTFTMASSEVGAQAKNYYEIFQTNAEQESLEFLLTRTQVQWSEQNFIYQIYLCSSDAFSSTVSDLKQLNNAVGDKQEKIKRKITHKLDKNPELLDDACESKYTVSSLQEFYHYQQLLDQKLQELLDDRENTALTTGTAVLGFAAAVTLAMKNKLGAGVLALTTSVAAAISAMSKLETNTRNDANEEYFASYAKKLFAKGDGSQALQMIYITGGVPYYQPTSIYELLAFMTLE